VEKFISVSLVLLLICTSKREACVLISNYITVNAPLVTTDAEVCGHIWHRVRHR